MTATLLRALDALDSTPSATDSADSLATRVDAVEDRITAFEGHQDQSSQRLDDSDRAAVVERIQAMRTDGMTTTAIAGILNREGVPTFSGRGKWQSSTVRNL